jgi:hypothetical protein
VLATSITANAAAWTTRDLFMKKISGVVGSNSLSNARSADRSEQVQRAVGERSPQLKAGIMRKKLKSEAGYGYVEGMLAFVALAAGLVILYTSLLPSLHAKVEEAHQPQPSVSATVAR